MNKFTRIIKHRWLDETDAARLLGPSAAKYIQERVAASEKHHSAEIRVCVEAGLPLSYLWRHATARDRALTMFGKLRVWDTEANNGVLIYLLLAEQAIEIVADRGLARHVSQAQWDEILDGMREAFRAGRFEEGLHAAIDAVDRILVRCYPSAENASNPNELPDMPHLG